MYVDPTHIRDNVIKVRLNDPELRLLTAAAEYNRSQLAAFARELIIEQLQLPSGQDAIHDDEQPHLAPDDGGSGGAETGAARNVGS